jgi:hypothetical protein
MLSISQISQALQYGALQAFGLTMPRLAPDWSPNGASNPSFTVTDDATHTSPGKPIMTITSSANWAAPLDAGFLVVAGGHPLPVTLVQAGGEIESSPGVLLTIFEQEWLRLGRLYCQILEESDTTRPERERGLSCRPVPRYIFFPNQTIAISSPAIPVGAGFAEAWDDLGFAGDARFYDGDGLQIDPIAVMAAFEAILTKYPGLQAVALGSVPVDPIPLKAYLTSGSAALAAKKETRVLLVQPSGSAYSGKHLTGLTVVDSHSGLYELSGSPASIGLDHVDANTFTQDDHDRLVFGPASSGRLSSSFTPPAVPQGSPTVTLARDFYTIRVVELKPYLNGVWPAASSHSPPAPSPDLSSDPASAVQRHAPVRINENISFLLDGNDVLGAIHTTLASGSPSGISHGSPSDSDVSLVVAQAIDGDFPIPSTVGTTAHWPMFPPGIPVDPNATLSISLKTQVALLANWVPPTANTPVPVDVVLQIGGLPANAWVRVYPRMFLPSSMLARGDGQGREVPASGTVVMNLTDPLSLRDPITSQVSVPSSGATLMFDMVVVLPNGKSRIYGGLTVGIGNSVPTSPPLTPHTGLNPCGFATYQGISNAGVLGLGKVGKISPAPTTLLQWAQALLGEGTPRDAPRLPTMARRELLVAGAGADNASPSTSRVWTAVIGGGRITPELVCASSRIGAPGGFGGRETSVVGATTHGGILAYDIARHALRRSQDIFPRLVALVDAKWNIPDEPTAVGMGKTPSATNGTMAGAVLQTIAPYCESPELHAAWTSSDFRSGATTWLEGQPLDNSTNTTGITSAVLSALDALETKPAPPEPATETALSSTGTINQIEASAQRLAIELEREVTSVYYGRRDAQWALQSAIQTARHCIYIETSGFCSTAHPPGGSPSGSSNSALEVYAADLIATLRAQMAKMPGLRVMICVNKKPDFAPGYEGMASFEVQDRLAIVHEMTTPFGSPASSSQFVVFHPIGFPGRSARVETNVVVIDDIWAMIGGCTIRRRGLTFDGSSDLVFTDTLIENGRSAAIRDFRRALLANRLGIPIDSTQPSYVALSDANTAFGVVQDALSGGGLGKIAPIWDGTAPGDTPATPLPVDQANPDGRNFDEFTAALVSVLGIGSGAAV